MKLQLDPTIVYRVPRFPYQSSIADCWDELKAAIAASSKDFYPLIAEVEAKDIDRLPERVKLTIWKYFNRAKYRCVPYGSFATVGIFNSRKSTETPLAISAEPEVHAYTDWSAIQTFHPNIDLDEVMLFSNSSWYLLTDGMRYIGKGKEGYELLDNVQDTLVLEILRHCKTPVALADLMELLAEPVPINELKELLQQMIDLQMLYTSAHSNIIGEDYWTRSGYQSKPDEQRYEIATNLHLGGTLPSRIFQHVPELAERLERIVSANQSKSLQKFIEGFQRRFEGKEVPLMVALDPEMGLGYAELEVGGIDDELIAAMATRRIPAEKTDSPVEQFFKKQLGGGQTKVINMDGLELYFRIDQNHRFMTSKNKSATNDAFVLNIILGGE